MGARRRAVETPDLADAEDHRELRAPSVQNVKQTKPKSSRPNSRRNRAVCRTVAAYGTPPGRKADWARGDS